MNKLKKALGVVGLSATILSGCVDNSRSQISENFIETNESQESHVLDSNLVEELMSQLVDNEDGIAVMNGGTLIPINYNPEMGGILDIVVEDRYYQIEKSQYGFALSLLPRNSSLENNGTSYSTNEGDYNLINEILVTACKKK